VIAFTAPGADAHRWRLAGGRHIVEAFYQAMSALPDVDAREVTFVREGRRVMPVPVWAFRKRSP
jgi:hypothetical protein